MSEAYERTEQAGGTTFKIYRGEGAALLAFDMDASDATEDFVGFTVEVKYPGSADWGALRNRLHFQYPPGSESSGGFSTREAPLQKFRWTHVPQEILEGEYRYRLTPKYMRGDGSLVTGTTVENAMTLTPETIDGFVNIGFTRGFASSQAYDRLFNNQPGILPPPGGASKDSLDHDMAPYEDNYHWLGFEARRLIHEFIDEAERDPTLTLDALLYESREPDILRRFERLGSRMRAVVDDHGDHGEPNSAETLTVQRLQAAGAEVRRTHFWRQQHNKVLILRRNGIPVRALAGSTNFSLRGLYIQSNNVLVFEDGDVSSLFGQMFDAYWTDPLKFRNHPLAKQWHVARDVPGSRFSFCFSPHSDSALSLDPVAQAIRDADSSVLYAVVFLNQLRGSVREALNDVVGRPLFSYGVAQRVGGLAVRKPDGSRGLLPFAYIGQNAPEPFRSEWNGQTAGHSNMVHHKFVVTDFNGTRPTVFTGSSNMAAGGEKANGDHMIMIEDRKVAIAYAIEALRMFDHFHFRVSLQEGDITNRILTLAKPPKSGEKAWFASYYAAGHVKERDRRLFVSG